MKRTIQILTVLLISNSIFSQNIDTSLVGKYCDGIGNVTITELLLRENGTFYLKTPDPIFSYSYEDFENEGLWIAKNDSIILNPELTERKRQIELIEKDTSLTDSIFIKIRYYIDYFRSDTFVKREEHDFQLMTICINKKSKYFNLVRHPQLRMCAFAPRLKNQILIDSSNTFKFKIKELDKIGVLTYGFEDFEWIKVSNANSNLLEIEIIQQIDFERTPRNREIIVDGEKVYFYKRKGRVDKSQSSLKKVTKIPAAK